MDAKEKSRERNAKGLCLVCDSKADGSRGLCTAHYLEIYRFLKSLPPAEAAKKEAEAIETGRLLPKGVARKPGRKPSAFADLKADLQKQMPGAVSTVNEEVAQYDEQHESDAALIRETIARLQRRLVELEAKKKKPGRDRKSG